MNVASALLGSGPNECMNGWLVGCLLGLCAFLGGHVFFGVYFIFVKAYRSKRLLTEEFISNIIFDNSIYFY